MLLAVSLPVTASLGPGDPLPVTLGKNVGGEEIEASEFAGRVLIVTFWASWCPPCLKELPILEGILNAAGSDRLAVVAVNIEPSRRQFRRMVGDLRGTEVVVTHDPRGLISREFDLKGIPYTALAGKSGTIAFIHEGFAEESVSELVDQVNHLLAEDSEQATSTAGAE